MPLYEYECKKCKHRFEKIQKFSDQPVKKCPECGGPVEQLISAPAVQFKGTGWYVTDYAAKSPAKEPGLSGKTGGDTEEKSGKTEKEDKKSSSKEKTSDEKPKKTESKKQKESGDR